MKNKYQAQKFKLDSTTRVLVVEARYYQDINDALLRGASEALREHQISFDVISVPGALEIPPAVAIMSKQQNYDGYVALGCVIRGETTHYEIVSQESARGLMELGLGGIPIGNGILTVENNAQATERASPQKLNKGGEAAVACLSLISLKQNQKNQQAVA